MSNRSSVRNPLLFRRFPTRMLQVREESPRRLTQNASGFERTFAFLSTTYLIGTWTPFLNGLQPSTDPTIEAAIQGNAIAQLAGAAVYSTALGLLLNSNQKPWRRLIQSPALLCFVAFAVISVFWSQSPEVSVRRLAGVIGCVIFALYLSVRFSPTSIVEMIARAYGIAIVVSVLLSLALPSVGGQLLDAPGGVWGHKNDLGRALVFSALAAWTLLASRSTLGPAYLLFVLLGSLGLVAVSRSAQSVLVSALSLGVLLPFVALVARSHRKIDANVLLMTLTLAGLAALATEYAAPIVLDWLGRDATLTDRTLIWDLVVDFGNERPLLGYGYGSFWTSQAAYIFGDRWQVIDHAHNGYLDIWLELGYAGFTLFALLLLSASVRAWNTALAERNSAARFFPAFLLAAMMLNAVGHVFPAHNSIYWTLLCYSALLPRRARVTARRPSGEIAGPVRA